MICCLVQNHNYFVVYLPIPMLFSLRLLFAKPDDYIIMTGTILYMFLCRRHYKYRKCFPCSLYLRDRMQYFRTTCINSNIARQPLLFAEEFLLLSWISRRILLLTLSSLNAALPLSPRLPQAVVSKTAKGN